METIDAISDADAGTVGEDSSTDDMGGKKDDDSGTGFMTWVMYIGGAVLVMALIAGACYLLMQNKDAEDFSHEQTEMTGAWSKWSHRILFFSIVRV